MKVLSSEIATLLFTQPHLPILSKTANGSVLTVAQSLTLTLTEQTMTAIAVVAIVAADAVMTTSNSF